jgi:putative MATE family efflux protein
MDRSYRLEHASIPRLLLSFSLPAIVGMMAQALYSVVDRIFVGRALGADALAGITVSFPFMLILLAFSMLIGLGGGALISIRLGEKKQPAAEQVLGNVLLLLVGVALAVSLLGLLWLDPLLRLFGASQAALPYAHDYSQIIVFGAIFQIVSFGLNAAIRAEGNPKIAMFTMLIGVLLNVILAPILIFVFGLGTRGAGIATVVSQAASTAWVLAYFFGGKSLLKLHAKNLRPQWPICVAIVAIGSPQWAMQMVASVQNSILNNQLNTYGGQLSAHGGDLAVAAMGILYSVAMIVAMPIFGINQGAQPIMGYNFGAQRFDRVKHTLLIAILAASAIAVFGFALAMLFPREIICLFHRRGDNGELVALGTHAIRLSLLMLPLVGFQTISACYFQAVGKPKHAIFLMLSRQLFLLIPAVLILPRFFGLNGVWAAIPTADLGSSMLTGIWLRSELRHLDRRHLESSQGDSPLLVSPDYPGGG